MLKLPNRWVVRKSRNSRPVTAINCFLPTEVLKVRITQFMESYLLRCGV